MNPNSNDEYEYGSEDDDENDLWFMTKAIKMREMMQQEGESSRTKNPIYSEYDDAEAYLMRHYFGEHPKYPEYKFRHCYRMRRKVFLEIVEGVSSYNVDPLPEHFKLFKFHPNCTAGTKNDIVVLNNSPLLDDIIDDISPVARFIVNGVQYEKGYYMADDIYPQWETFIKTILVARDEKHGLFKRGQEGARKDVERAFGVLQGHWEIIQQPTHFYHINKI
uniref:Protein ALP1-like n=1 Tax=Tanacetum cinerariifolium TaxID=118510 RepID=A0A699GZ96_TANCI|nr:hypothetical protein [Tanacetum cinerariifolium]